MKTLSTLVILLTLSVAATARPEVLSQPPQAPQVVQQQLSPLDQALGQRLIEEVNANIQLRVQLIEAQTKMRTLEESLKLKGKTP